MSLYRWSFGFIVIALFSSWGLAQQGEDVAIDIPLEGLRMKCCEGAVVKALKPIQGVQGVQILKEDEAKLARITLKKEGTLLALSIVRKKLAEVSKGKGCCCRDAEFRPKQDEISLDLIRRVPVRGSSGKDALQRLLDSIKAVKGIKDAEMKVRGIVPKGAPPLLTILLIPDEQAGDTTFKVLKKAIKDANYTITDVVLKGRKVEKVPKKGPKKGCGCCGGH
jgi:hypothetical protein